MQMTLKRRNGPDQKIRYPGVCYAKTAILDTTVQYSIVADSGILLYPKCPFFLYLIFLSGRFLLFKVICIEHSLFEFCDKQIPRSHFFLFSLLFGQF